MAEQLRDLRDVHGHEVFAIVASGEGGLHRLLRRHGIPFACFDFDFPPAGGWHVLLNTVRKLADALRTGRYDVVQTHLFASMVLGRMAAWLADVPVRAAMIAGPYHLEAATPRWIDRSTFWMDDVLIPSCEYSKRLLAEMGAPERKLRLAYYGPDSRRFDPANTIAAALREDIGLPQDVRLVGMVSYFYPVLPESGWTPPQLHGRANKRQEDLIRAAPAILSQFPSVRVVFIGSGWGEAGEAALKQARDLAAELGLQDRVFFLGYRTDVAAVLAALDVSVQAAISENLGGSIETLLMERPLVATRSGGLVDTVLDGKTGLLVAPLDPADLARGVVRMLQDPTAAKGMGETGRRLMLERFCLDRTVMDLDAIYRECMATGRRGYRLPVTMWRIILAGPVFTYLAARLYWDVKVAIKLEARRAAAASSVRSDGRPRIERYGRASVQGAGRWLASRPLHMYGWGRQVLAGTRVLRVWDRAFAWLRGRPPPA